MLFKKFDSNMKLIDKLFVTKCHRKICIENGDLIQHLHMNCYVNITNILSIAFVLGSALFPTLT